MVKKRNAFAFFMESYLEKQKRMGRYISKKTASEESGPLWNALSAVEKQKYIDMADAEKNEISVKKVALIEEKIYRGNSSTEENAIRYLTARIRHEKALRDHKFYVIHCNYYCRTYEGTYLLGEIALAEFNLQEGITQTYHTIINPGQIPIGYAFEVKKMIDDVHGLPMPPHEEGEGNLNRILEAIKEIMRSGNEIEEEFPPLFAVHQDIPFLVEILKKLGRKGKFHSELKIYPIYKLLFWLKNKCAEYCSRGPIFQVMSNAMDEIEKDVYRYCPGISCEYHEDLSEKFHSCSLSVVRRLIYIICDHCYKQLNIEVVKGKHTYEKCSERDAVAKPPEPEVKFITPKEPDLSDVSSYASSEEDDPPQDGSEEGNSDVNEAEDDLSWTMVHGRGRNLHNPERKVGLPRF